MLRFTSYTDEFYIQEIHNGNKKVIDHFYAFAGIIIVRLIRNCFRKKIRRPIFSGSFYQTLERDLSLFHFRER